MDYEITVYINDGSVVLLPVVYEKEYELRRDVTNIGTSGLLQKKEEIFQYFPPHRIDKIEVQEAAKSK
jgi:hypothetical protein